MRTTLLVLLSNDAILSDRMRLPYRRCLVSIDAYRLYLHRFDRDLSDINPDLIASSFHYIVSYNWVQLSLNKQA